MYSNWPDPNRPLPPQYPSDQNDTQPHSSLSHVPNWGTARASSRGPGGNRSQKRGKNKRPLQDTSQQSDLIRSNPSTMMQSQNHMPPYTSSASQSGNSGSSGIIADDRPWTAGQGHSRLGDGPVDASKREAILRGLLPSSPYPRFTPGQDVPSRHAPSYPLNAPHAPQYPSQPSLHPPISRSWTLDSPARSSLAPMEPCHLGRTISRSPLLVARSEGDYIHDTSADYSYPRSDNGQSRRVQPRKLGGPPKAKLGGPNGKTYEELRGGDHRNVSAPTSAPPSRRDEGIKRQQGAAEESEATWMDKPVTVRLPQSDVPTGTDARFGPTNALHLDRGSAGTVQMPEIDASIPAPSTKRGRGGSDPSMRKATVPQKEVRVSMPSSDAWQRLSASAAEFVSADGSSTLVDRPQSAEQSTSHGQPTMAKSDEAQSEDTAARPSDPQRPIESAAARQARLNAAAKPFTPTHSFTGSNTFQISLIRSGSSQPSTKLRTTAPIFTPSSVLGLTNRGTASTVSGTSSTPELTRQTTRRSESLAGDGSPAKRLRRDAPAFQPKAATSSANPYASLWEAAAVRVAASPVSHHAEFMNGAEGAVGIRSGGYVDSEMMNGPKEDVEATARASKGKLRPKAPAFVPTGKFAFTSGLSDPATASLSVEHRPSDQSKSGLYVPAGTVEQDVVANRSSPPGSPASRLHDLPDSANGVDGAAYPSAEQEVRSVSGSAAGETLQVAESGSRSPSPAFGLERLSDQSRPRSPVRRISHVQGVAHLPTESFGLPSPRHPEEDVFGPTDQSDDIDDKLFDTPLDNLPTPRELQFPYIPPPRTPTAQITATSSSARPSTATAPFETADGSPLLPRRYIETPATPQRDPSIESSIADLGSPTPARPIKARPSILPVSPRYPEPALIHNESPHLLAPKSEQPKLQINTATDDERFRDWVFPGSPSSIRPSMIRRFTVPMRDKSDLSLAGVASTAGLLDATAADASFGRKQLGVIPSQSTRTSVEFPLRVSQRRLTIANGELEGDGSGDYTARPADRELVGAAENDRLVKIEGLLQDMQTQQVAQGKGGVEVLVKLAGDVAGMMADLRDSVEDRLRVSIDPVPVDKTLRDELHAQRELLTGLLDHSKSTDTSAVAEETIRTFDQRLSTIFSGHSDLLSRVESNWEAQERYSNDARSAVDAIRSMKEDLELRKSSEEKKDEVIAQLRLQIDGHRTHQIRADVECFSLKERLGEVESRYSLAQTEQADLVTRLQMAEKLGKAPEREVEKLEATRMALEAQRDGLEAALRESFDRTREAEAELGDLQRERELEKRTAAQYQDTQETTRGLERKLAELAEASRTTQAGLMAELQRLREGLSDAGRAKSGEVDGLREDKRRLQNEVTELRKMTYDAASKIADADLRAAIAVNTATTVESDLRSSLSAAERESASAKRTLARLEKEVEAMKVEKLNATMIATERSGSMRLMEIRNQALVQENSYWRAFALSYDRREYNRYTKSQPFRQADRPPPSPPTVIRTPDSPATARLAPEHPHTPAATAGNHKPGGDMGADLEATPDLTMSTSSSLGGIVVAGTPDEDGRLWKAVGET